ncbi:MAG TPA: polysaccharide biosynthesis/export family protein [Hyphomicrobiales bacterium]|nr:polysaccharide biosynthesis/export family protein [Hyphomicrobiales bacterium]
MNSYTLSEDTAYPETQTSTAREDAIDMSAVERVQLRVLNYGDLSGEFSIDSNKTLSLPGVGRIFVDGKTPSEVEDELANKISIYARRDVKVSIEILKYRNYFIMGMITQPGANEWQPGLNIIKAIALARGTVRQPTAVDDPLARLSIQQSRTQLQFSLALLARLKAERDGSKEIQIDEQLSSVLARMPSAIRLRLRDFVDSQSDILNEQRKLTLTQIAGLEQELATAQGELEAAIAQEKAIKDQFDISSSLLADVEQLKDKKLVSNSRYLAQRSDLMSSQIRYAESQSLTERARARVASIARQIGTLRAQQRVALNDRIEALQREVAQLELSLLQSSPNGQGLDGAAKLFYNIARQTPSGIVTFNADVFSEIKPGDVIVVSAGEPENTAGDKPQELSKNEQSSAAGIIQRAIEASSAAQTAPAGRTASSSVVR